jgi:WD40 repeat protein
VRLLRPSGEVVAERALPKAALALALAPDGKTLAVAGFDGTTSILALPDLAVRGTLQHESPNLGVAWRGADQVAVAVGTDLALWGAAPDWKVVGRRHLAGTRDAILAVAVSPDGATFATGGYSYGAVSLWDATKASEEEPARRLGADASDGPETIVRALAFFPDGQHLAAGGTSGLRLVTLADGKVSAPLAGHGDEVTAVAVAPDGKHVATASADHTLLVWSTP